MAVAAVAAAQGRARRLIVNGLREQGAVSAEHAAGIPQPNHLRRAALSRLLRQGAVIEAAPDRYWLDEARWTQVEAARRRLALRVLVAVAAVLAGVAVVAFLFGGAR
jgi:hypothetical protein